MRLYLVSPKGGTSNKSFYTNKRLEFDIRQGIRIVTDQGQYIGPDLLSSGEKQLLLLFCSVLLAREKPSIFIIDEPEISLNVKWQRQLVGSLLSLVGSTDVQFVLATHSVELLARHRKRVVKLVNTKK